MLGCIQPMSSPMMKMMLGFCCCCATAGVLATIPMARNASRASRRFRRTVMSKPPRSMKIEDARRRTVAVRHGLRCAPRTRDAWQAENSTNLGFRRLPSRSEWQPQERSMRLAVSRCKPCGLHAVGPVGVKLGPEAMSARCPVCLKAEMACISTAGDDAEVGVRLLERPRIDVSLDGRLFDFARLLGATCERVLEKLLRTLAALGRL